VSSFYFAQPYAKWLRRRFVANAIDNRKLDPCPPCNCHMYRISLPARPPPCYPCCTSTPVPGVVVVMRSRRPSSWLPCNDACPWTTAQFVLARIESPCSEVGIHPINDIQEFGRKRHRPVCHQCLITTTVWTKARIILLWNVRVPEIPYFSSGLVCTRRMVMCRPLIIDLQRRPAEQDRQHRRVLASLA
jgi:hypothetical protein